MARVRARAVHLHGINTLYHAVSVYMGMHKTLETLETLALRARVSKPVSWSYTYRLYHAVEVYTGMYKTAETGLETRARSARVSKVSKVLCIPVYTDTAWYKVFMPCRYTARARTRAMAPAA